MRRKAIPMYLRYLWAVLRHKWFVFWEAWRLGIPWLGLIHDWSKFLPYEFIPYARYFYGKWPTIKEAWVQCPSYTGPTQESVQHGLDYAWNHHQKRNKHHWQYWLLVLDHSQKTPEIRLAMPLRYRLEMLADWIGAGKAYGNPDLRAWYLENGDKMRLHPDVQLWVEGQLEQEKRVEAKGD